MTDRASPLDTVLDLFVYAPVGLALVAGEEIPKLAARGRAQVGGQLALAKVVGQFTVAQGRRQLARRRSPPGRRGWSRSAPASPSGAAADANRSHLDGDVGAARAGPHQAVPGPADLAIPGYDSLAASQVIPRLAGLSADELAAVDAYERAHRARRTILTRVHQLQER